MRLLTKPVNLFSRYVYPLAIFLWSSTLTLTYSFKSLAMMTRTSIYPKLLAILIRQSQNNDLSGYNLNNIMVHKMGWLNLPLTLLRSITLSIYFWIEDIILLNLCHLLFIMTSYIFIFHIKLNSYYKAWSWQKKADKGEKQIGKLIRMRLKMKGVYQL